MVKLIAVPAPLTPTEVTSKLLAFRVPEVELKVLPLAKAPARFKVPFVREKLEPVRHVSAPAGFTLLPNLLIVRL